MFHDIVQKTFKFISNILFFYIWASFLLGIKEVPFSTLLAYTTSTKCAVFEDLWNKGFYITKGQKFGGDFLVYLGIFILNIFNEIYCF